MGFRIFERGEGERKGKKSEEVGLGNILEPPKSWDLEKVEGKKLR